jgi:hypothetical protein
MPDVMIVALDATFQVPHDLERSSSPEYTYALSTPNYHEQIQYDVKAM